MLFVGATGCLSVGPSNQTGSNAPTGSGTDFNVTISARQVPMIMTTLVNMTPPRAENQFVAIECSLRDNNVQNLFTVWREWKARDAQGTLYEEHTNTVVIEGAYPKTTIHPGETAKGIIVYEVTNGTQITSMRWTDETTGTHTLTTPVKS